MNVTSTCHACDYTTLTPSCVPPCSAKCGQLESMAKTCQWGTTHDQREAAREESGRDGEGRAVREGEDTLKTRQVHVHTYIRTYVCMYTSVSYNWQNPLGGDHVPVATTHTHGVTSSNYIPQAPVRLTWILSPMVNSRKNSRNHI